MAVTTPTTQVCAHVVEKAGHWTCAYPLKPEVARKRHSSYRFTQQDGRVLKVEVINGAGALREDTIPVSVSPLQSGVVEYQWSADGKGFWATSRRFGGTIQERWKAGAGFRDKYHELPASETDPEKARVKGNGVCREKWTVDARGFVQTVRFYNWKDQPRKDLYGAHGYRYERNAQGVIITEVPLNKLGKPAATELGQVKFTYKYDASGNLLSAAAENKEGKPSYLKNFHYSKITYDSVGNPLSEAFLDKEGKPAKNSMEIGMWKATYDATGNLVRKLYFDTGGKPMLDKEKSAGASFTYDANGRQTGSCTLGLDGKPSMDINGVICRKWIHDVKGVVTEAQFLDAQGKPLARKDGIARIKYKETAGGQVSEEWYYDIAGKPALDQERIHGTITTTDVGKHTLLMCNYGIDKKKKKGKDGVACTRMTFNEDDDVVEEWTTDEKDALVLNADGVAGCVTKFDEFAREVEHWYYGTQRELVMHKELEHAGMVSKYDADGEIEDMIAYDADREPIKPPDALEDPDDLNPPDWDGVNEPEP
ncbi:hypothetical protein KKC22_02725 [Myxococcota bacterium]|nr:hypothetical protein [Myxococcota bacterium]